MAVEVIAVSDMFSIVATLSDEVEHIFGYRILLQLLTDSKSLFDVVSKGFSTYEKRLML